MASHCAGQIQSVYSCSGELSIVVIAYFPNQSSFLSATNEGGYGETCLWDFFAFGVVPLLTAYGVWNGRNWARPLAIVLAWVWVSFIAFRTYLFGFQIIDALLLVLQLAVVLLMFSRVVKKHFYVKAMKHRSFSFDDFDS